jgi:hypothetical protein
MHIKPSRAIVFGALSLAALAAATQQGALLRRELKADAKDVYKIETTLKQNMTTPGGDQDLEIKSALTYTLITKKVDTEKGIADVEAETTTDKVDLSGSLASMVPGVGEKVPPFKVEGKLDARGRLTTKLPKMDPQTAMFAASTQTLTAVLFVELPEKQVSVGDSWTIAIPKNVFFGDLENKLTAKLTGEKEVDGVKVWIVAVTGQLKTDTSIGKVMEAVGAEAPGGMDGTIKGTADITAEGLVDKATGKTISLTSNMKSKNSLDLGMAIDMTGTGVMKVSLAK